MKQKIIYLLILLLSFSVIAQKSLDDVLRKYHNKEVPNISATILHNLQAQGNVVILDSREKKEFDVSHISSATFVGYTNFSIEDVSKEIPNKDTFIVVYCTVGIRSEKIVEKLQEVGYNNIKNLYGGICEWKNNDFLIFDSNNAETDSIHTFSKQWSKWFKKGKTVY